MGFFKKLYAKKEALKPSWWAGSVEPYVPLVIGAFNPIAGAIALGLHGARKQWEERNFPQGVPEGENVPRYIPPGDTPGTFGGFLPQISLGNLGGIPWRSSNLEKRSRNKRRRRKRTR